MPRNSPSNYGTVARSFHWATAFIVIFLLGLGLYMEALEVSTTKLTLYGLHKSFGFLVLGLVILRIIWRATHPPPASLASHKPYEIYLAHFIHICLYLGLLGMPLSGWLMSSAADFPHSFFNLFSMPDVIPGKNEFIFKTMRLAHTITAWALIAAITLHIAGALKHHLFDRDATLRRMNFARPVPAFALILILMAIGTTIYFLPRATLEAAQSDNAALAEIARGDNVAPNMIVEGSISEPAPITAPSWTLLPESYVEFTATVQNSPFTGRFTGLSGSINFDPANLSGSRAHVSVPITSVSSGSTERDQTMRLPAWFDSDNFPESVFESRNFTHIEGDNYRVAGHLTIRAVTLPLEVPFKLVITQDKSGNNIAKMHSEFTLQRLDFGVGQGDWAGTGIVANAVNVRVSLIARSETP